ncbi:hypothetical protein PG995_012972 [Apiospora arundinis]
MYRTSWDPAFVARKRSQAEHDEAMEIIDNSGTLATKELKTGDDENTTKPSPIKSESQSP